MKRLFIASVLCICAAIAVTGYSSGSGTMAPIGLLAPDHAFYQQHNTDGTHSTITATSGTFGDVSTNNLYSGWVRMYRTGSQTWKVVDPNGTEIDISSSTTGGLQEAINYAVTHCHPFWVNGGGRYSAPGVNVIHCSTTLEIPPLELATIIIENVTINFPGSLGSDPGVRFDSCMQVYFRMDGQIVYGGTGTALEFNVRNALPYDGVKSLGASTFHFPTIWGGTNGVYFRPVDGPIGENTFTFQEINHCERAIFVLSTNDDSTFYHNRIVAPLMQGPQDANKPFVLIGGSANTHVKYNEWHLSSHAILNGQRAISTYETGGLYFGSISSDLGVPSDAIFLESTATGNQFFMGTMEGGYSAHANSANNIIRYQDTIYGNVGIDTDPNASLDIGGGHEDHINGVDDLLVKDDAEIDGNLYIEGDANIVGTLNINLLDTTGAGDLDYGSADVTDHTFIADGGTAIIDGSYQFPDADGSPSVVGEFQYDNTVTGLSDGALCWYDDDAIRYLVDLATLPSDDDYVVAYDADANSFYMKADAGAAGGDSISIDGVGVVDPDFVSTGDIDFTDSSNTVTADLNDDKIKESHLNATNTPGAGEDNYVLTYNHAGGNFTWAPDQDSGGSTAYDDIADPDAATTINFDDDERVTWAIAEDSAASFFTIDDSDAAVAANTYLFHLLYSVDDDEANADYIKCEDAGGVVFTVQDGGDTAIEGNLTVGKNTHKTIPVNGTSKTLQLAVHGDDVANTYVSYMDRASDTHSPTMLIARAHGTHTSPAVVADDSVLGQIGMVGWDGTDMAFGAKILARVHGTPGSNDMPAEIVLAVAEDGTSTATEQVTLYDGVFGPITDNDVDIGTSGAEFKDGYFDGTVNTDALTVGAAATMSEADMEKLDDITNGTAAANKALVLDGNADITSGLNSLTATTFSGNGAALTDLDGENITNDTIDADSLDWGAFTDLGEGGVVEWGNIAEGEIANSVIISADIKNDTIDSDDYAADSIDNEHINWADIDNLGDEGLITVADTTDATCWLALWESATGDLAAKSDGGLTYNASTGVLSATGLSGPLTGNVTGNVSGSSGSCTGNAATATALETARAIGGVNFDGTAAITPTTIVVADTTDTSAYVALWESATGDLLPKSDAGLTYNAGTAALAATTFVGALTGNADTCTTASAGDAAVDFFGAGVTAVTDATTCTDIEGTGLSITTGVLNWAYPDGDIGDLTYSSGSVTIDADAVALTTDTSGNYVASISNGSGITGGDGGSEGATLTIAATLGTAIDTTEITDGTIELADINTVNAFADEDILTYETDSGGGLEGMTIGELLATGSSTSLSDTAALLYKTDLDSESELESQITDMANIIQATEIDTFSELDTLVADKALVNKADGAVWSGTHDFSSATVTLPERTANVDRHWNFNIWKPNSVYDDDTQVCIDPNTNAALTITKIIVTCNADPGTELDFNLKFADAFIGLANATVIAAMDTTNGAAEVSSFSDATVPAGKCVYIEFDGDPDANITQVSIKVDWDYD